jgi:hypothetical protein
MRLSYVHPFSASHVGHVTSDHVLAAALCHGLSEAVNQRKGTVWLTYRINIVSFSCARFELIESPWKSFNSMIDSERLGRRHSGNLGRQGGDRLAD